MAENSAAQATVYEVHAQKLRQRHNCSCSSLDTLSSDASPRSSVSVPPSLLFRYPGARAGSHPHMPWQHSVFRDAYERVNVWSHGVPGILFFVAAALARCWAAAAPKPIAFFCIAAGCTHLLSALGHVYPDSHSLEKADHLGIVGLIVGNPLSSLMAIEHGHIPAPMYVIAVLLVGGAFFPPALRVAAFGAGISATVLIFGKEIYTANLGWQLVLFAVAAVTFLRNAGHHRAIGLSDHHILHYVVTAACLLQISNLFALAKRNAY